MTIQAFFTKTGGATVNIYCAHHTKDPKYEGCLDFVVTVTGPIDNS